MQELNDETTEVEPQNTISETKASIGKFDSPEALYKSYLSLEKDYTKKCQLLKQTENAACDDAAPVIYEARLEKIINRIPGLSSLKEDLDNLSGELDERLAALLLKMTDESNQYEMLENQKREWYNDENVRGNIFAEMLEEFQQSLPPKLIKNRGQIAVTPPHRPRNLCEATSLAKKIIKNRRIE